MNLFHMYYRFDQFAHDTFRKKYSRKYSERQLRDAKADYENWKPLSDDQKAEIANFWGIVHPDRSDFITHEIMMNVKNDYDVRYCPEKIFRLYLDPATADRKLVRAWNDKNYFERFQPGLPFPHAYVRNANGYFLDHDYHLISQEEAKEIILSNLPLIIKPSLISGEGRNLRLISNEKEADEIFTQYDKDYVVQEYILQCAELKRMSPRSVNIFRLVTAMVDGEPRLLTGHLLCNTTDSIAVNANSGPGTGVVVIGLSNDGILFDTGFYENAKSLRTLPSGVTFGGLGIPSYREAVNLALEAHKSMPMFGFIGWDITIDEKNQPVILEWNLGGMEIYHAQLSDKPLFGEYSDYFANIAKTLIKQGK